MTLHDKIMNVDFVAGTSNPELEFVPTVLAEIIASREDVLDKVLNEDFDTTYKFIHGVSESGQFWLARTKKDETKYRDFLDDVEDV